ncbi:hypothetical protein C8J38_11026 [Rhizobium sp. PP-WC-2G-219]|nr:hypothetical protein C8J38_11026 [Rhizobium sp. PP-WC-2G-219]
MTEKTQDVKAELDAARSELAATVARVAKLARQIEARGIAAREKTR